MYDTTYTPIVVQVAMLTIMQEGLEPRVVSGNHCQFYVAMLTIMQEGLEKYVFLEEYK